jgi:hypothetical protein
MLESCHETAHAVDAYIQDHFFDPFGLMYSAIDSQRDAPFERDFITPIKVPRRAAAEPWAYWTYEDSVMSMGLYLDALVLKHKVTGDASCLERAAAVWGTIHKIYSCSQVHGIGCFLRPYAGFEGMARFMEPLGTDQASPLFSGLYRYLPYAGGAASDIRRLMLRTLEWYERQGFQYFYYKSFIHRYEPGDPLAHHANSYYLPAIAWAAKESPEDDRWVRHLEERLDHFRTGGYVLCRPGGGPLAFCWGSDLPILRDLLGSKFNETFTSGLLNEAHRVLLQDMSGWEENGTVRRICPESAEPGFEPHVDPSFDAKKDFGFAYFATRHHGRARPRHEIDFLIALAAVGYDRERTAAKAAELLALRRDVPRDFTAFLADDYHCLPETVHLYARSVGPIMVEWWRNYWLLRWLASNEDSE